MYEKQSTTEKDPFDEFEFKPLSEGLGFYKKAQAPTEPEIHMPLPRKEDAPPTSSVLKKVGLPNKPGFIEKPILQDVSANLENRSTKTTQWIACPPEPGAMLLDGLLLTAFYLLCLIGLILSTRVDFFTILSISGGEVSIYGSLLLLAGVLNLIYLGTSRAFLGSTLGEWVFDQRLGSPKQFASPLFILRSFVRAFAIALTFGVPSLIGAILHRDLIGRLFKLELHKKI